MGKAKTPPKRNRPTKRPLAKRPPGRAAHPTPAAGSFAYTVSLEELIRQQGLKPITDLGELSGMWPADFEPDEFLKWLEAERTERRRVARDEGRV
jgi:hypothetical protein